MIKSIRFLLILFFMLMPGFLVAHPSIDINGTAQISLGAGCQADVRANWFQSGQVTGASGVLAFVGSSDDTIHFQATEPLPHLLIQKENGANVHQATALQIGNRLHFASGSLITHGDTLTLEPTAIMSGEHAGNYLVGALTTVRAVGTAADSMGGAGVYLSAGTDDLGQVRLVRMTGPAGQVTINGEDGINRRWFLDADQPPANGRAVTFGWNASDDNALDLTSARAWRSENGVDWEPVGQAQDASGSRQVTVNTTTFSDWTINDAAGGFMQSIPLTPNQWQTVSLYLQPNDPAVSALLASVDCLEIMN